MERNTRVVKNLNAAIETMRQACGEAERAISNSEDEVACQRVLHALSWGFANASSGIETAMAAIEDAHAMQVETLNMSNISVTGTRAEEVENP